MLYMRIVAHSAAREDADLTARARIRDVAIRCFADEGFDASVRRIAQKADVSPGLITHHFGSKAGLRAECDDEVLRRYSEVKNDAIDQPAGSIGHLLASPGANAEVLVYMLRAVHAGGPAAHDFLERLIDNARGVMARAVTAGMVRPSRDEEARLRYLAYQATGAMLVQFITMPGATPDEFVASLQAAGQDQILPTLELYTEGLLTDDTLLEQYLTHAESPEGGTTHDR